MECLQCHSGRMREPDDKHPAYVICDMCGAYELTYSPASYQENLHTIPYQLAKDGSIKPQIIGVFGG